MKTNQTDASLTAGALPCVYLESHRDMRDVTGDAFCRHCGVDLETERATHYRDSWQTVAAENAALRAEADRQEAYRRKDTETIGKLVGERNETVRSLKAHADALAAALEQIAAYNGGIHAATGEAGMRRIALAALKVKP